jgi:serine/threonine-protein kinase RsbW
MRQKIFPGTLDSLAPMRSYVADVAQAAGLDSGTTYKLCLAVDEIATNIVLHGYEEANLEGDITIEVLQDLGHLVIRLLDHGRTYDPDHVPQPDFENPLNQQNGGWGLFLSTISVDQFDYSSSAFGNVHRFVVHLPGVDRPQP